MSAATKEVINLMEILPESDQNFVLSHDAINWD